MGKYFRDQVTSDRLAEHGMLELEIQNNGGMFSFVYTHNLNSFRLRSKARSLSIRRMASAIHQYQRRVRVGSLRPIGQEILFRVRRAEGSLGLQAQRTIWHMIIYHVTHIFTLGLMLRY